MVRDIKKCFLIRPLMRQDSFSGMHLNEEQEEYGIRVAYLIHANHYKLAKIQVHLNPYCLRILAAVWTKFSSAPHEKRKIAPCPPPAPTISA